LDRELLEERRPRSRTFPSPILMPDHRYRYAHKRLRKRWAPKVRAGKVICARCGEPIGPGELWDLDHDDEDPLQRRYLGPSHRRCNRAVVTHLKEALAPQRHSREW
jgi:hypothetical protein